MTKQREKVSTVKKRIQQLLTEYVREVYGTCIAKNVDGKRCTAKSIQADHIITRAFSPLFAKKENVVPLCYHHHFHWKRQNPVEYVRLVEKTLGKRKLNALYRSFDKNRKYKTFTRGDWLSEEKKLLRIIEKIRKSG